MTTTARESAMCATMGVNPASYVAARNAFTARDGRGIPACSPAQLDALRHMAPAVPRRTLRRWVRGRPILDTWIQAIELGIASAVPPLQP